MPDANPPLAPAAAGAPVSSTTQSSEPFELGLVLAGAISAGAYTSGVLDFILEALDEWETAKKDPARTDIPRHRVVIRAASGASAGGMCAAQLAGISNRACPPVHATDTATRSDNVFFESWVNKIDILPLLGTSDPSAESLLDCTIIDQIAKDAFNPKTLPQERPYIVPGDFTVFTTVTNLRGIPYLIHFNSVANQGHDLSRHGHHWQFLLVDGAPAPVPPAHVGLLPINNRATATWTALGDSAVASGAFPVGLRPRRLTQPLNHVSDTHGQPTPTWSSNVTSVPPNSAFNYWAVDGGTVNNEPLELVRLHLAARQPDQKNPRDPDKARGITLLIDPFVGLSDTDFADDTINQNKNAIPLPLLAGAFKTINAIKNQARFKPEELALANNPNVYSRFLIAPVRPDPGKNGNLVSPYAIACGSLGGFGGFFARRFRAHDYTLGRRNAQQFLRRHFALKIDPEAVNPLFGATFAQLKTLGAFEDPINSGQWFMPLIPLTGTALKEVPEPLWPAKYSTDELTALEKAIRKRADHLVDLLVLKGTGWFKRFGLGLAWKWLLRSRVVDAAVELTKSSLKKHGLA